MQGAVEGIAAVDIAAGRLIIAFVTVVMIAKDHIPA